MLSPQMDKLHIYMCNFVYLNLTFLIPHWTTSCYNVNGIHGPPIDRLAMTLWWALKQM